MSQYIPELKLNELTILYINLKCKIDDIIDAICLSVTANLTSQGYCETIPKDPMMDETGLYMQMIIPRL